MSLFSWLKGLFKADKVATSTATISKTWVSNGVKNVQTVVRSVGPAAEAAGKTVMTWANAAKVALVGGFGYLFLHGGASEVVSNALGIDEGAAQILIWIVALFFLLLLAYWLAKWIRSKASDRVRQLSPGEARSKYSDGYVNSYSRHRSDNYSRNNSSSRSGSKSSGTGKKGVRR